MLSSSTDPRALAMSATQALQRGDAAAARELFQRAVATGQPDASVLLGLALACRQLKARDETLAALDKVLALEPASLQALLMKGDHFLEEGDSQAGIAFYRMALRSAPPAARLPAALQGELRRAQQACEEHARKYEAYLQHRLAEHGFDPERSSGRFARSVDLMTGKRRIYYQQPHHYYFPELPQIQFGDPSQFPWLPAVEAAVPDIRSELLEVLGGPEAFAPYVESYRNRPKADTTGTMGNPNWSAFFLWKAGEIVPENAARCPKTVRALQDLPFCRIAGRSPSVLFSLLRPGARIPPHLGMINTRLICHIPLIVPENCGIRVGNETRTWTEGKALLLDDTIEHEAWNNSDKLRVVLLFDVWKPELTEEERALVVAAIEAVDSYGTKRPWRD
ncbi:MAG: aspartyl/asparaginyl beta-hydroxylase domain-containing protein [Rhizomicrobium sp.]